jgi:hypothetical protein
VQVHPQTNGADLVGRAFFEPEIGVCLITGLGPVVRHKLATRAQLRRHDNDAPLLSQGEHYTLAYTQTSTGEEHFSSLHEILHWIQTGPVLMPPAPQAPSNTTNAPITTPPFTPATLQYVPKRTSLDASPTLVSGGADVPAQKSALHQHAIATNHEPRITARNVVTFQVPATKITTRQKDIGANHNSRMTSRQRRISPRLSAARTAGETKGRVLHQGEQRVPGRGRHDKELLPGKQRVTRQGGLTTTAHLATIQPDDDMRHHEEPAAALGLMLLLLPPLIPPPGFENMTVDEDIERFRLLVEGPLQHEPDQDEDNDPDQDEDNDPSELSCFSATPSATHGDLTRALPKTPLEPVFPTGHLNLNPDGTTINYRKSHAGPHAAYWANADGEEIERLFVTGTIKPLRFRDIPRDKIITYVNPVCVEKTHDDGTLKFRTRLTIGGDRIIYPYDTSEVTAEMDAIKIMLNCMISEDANWTTVDLTGFYLGTNLPHPEYIRIPRNLIPDNVIEFYELTSYLNNDALYCSVHKTHYGLPQAGALSQQRLFNHLAEHGYSQIPSSPSVFRNHKGTIRFTLVVDDFAVVWKDKTEVDHFIKLSQNYIKSK